MKAKQRQLGGYDEVFPKFGELTRRVLMKEIWSGAPSPLSKRDKTLITLSCLTSLNRVEPLRKYIRAALRNGLTKEEIGEVFYQLAFYAGWPAAINAYEIAKDVYDEEKPSKKPGVARTKAKK